MDDHPAISQAEHPHTLQRLSDTYGVDVGDLRVLAADLVDLRADEDVSVDVGIELRLILSPDGERTHLFYWDQADDPF